MKILILKPSSLGDVVQALPVARLLRLRFPGATLHWWVNADLAPLLEGDPDIARIVPFERRRWANPESIGRGVTALRRLRAERYEWVLDLQGLARSATLAWLVRGRLTVGLQDWREGAPALYDVSVPRPSPATHAVDWYLAVLRALEVPVDRPYEWLPLRPAAAAAVAARSDAPETLWIALQPGARWTNKRWPVERFAETAQRLLSGNPQCRIAVLGGSADRPLGAAIAAAGGSRVLDLSGRLTLPEMVEWIRRCAVLVTNDTGPMHVAAALGRPVVGIFGPTDPRRTGPYGQTDRILRVPMPCAPCLKPACHLAEPLACLTRISVEAVVGAVTARLSSPVPAPCPDPSAP
ncbi:MAG: lipopolysaccharide heptosyltransferase II [Verrucomicrobia bacterium]|nr:lipopolysaccharide heptosyltransferase II [Verrucomicrobiota bacterium]